MKQAYLIKMPIMGVLTAHSILLCVGGGLCQKLLYVRPLQCTIINDSAGLANE